MGIFARHFRVSKREYTLLCGDLQGLAKRIERCSFRSRGSERGTHTASCLAKNICDRSSTCTDIESFFTLVECMQHNAVNGFFIVADEGNMNLYQFFEIAGFCCIGTDFVPAVVLLF